ncbi:MAG: 1-acyl-sn-glycerol-3-phosphate acyltransferase [Bacteroidales bacterium]|nr:1-acyl-sn-glycerol-3-phosphate acyltransferase [Candidatus Colimorpha onthohippi]
MKKLWVFIVQHLMGWRYDIPLAGTQPEIERCVIIVAPHTSVGDFLIGATCLWKLGVNAKIFMKKEFFNWFTTPILKHFGVIPVDRGNRNNHLVEQAVEYYNTHPRFALTITPEGTRKAVKRWKRGFYDIAIKAQVPIVPAFVDYKTKTMGVMKPFYPSGDFQTDLPIIMKYYENITPKHPECYNKTVIK